MTYVHDTVHMTVRRLSCYMNIPKDSKLVIQIVRGNVVTRTIDISNLPESSAGLLSVEAAAVADDNNADAGGLGRQVSRLTAAELTTLTPVLRSWQVIEQVEFSSRSVLSAVLELAGEATPPLCQRSRNITAHYNHFVI